MEKMILLVAIVSLILVPVNSAELSPQLAPSDPLWQAHFFHFDHVMISA
jgi:hypothetical protein